MKMLIFLHHYNVLLYTYKVTWKYLYYSPYAAVESHCHVLIVGMRNKNGSFVLILTFQFFLLLPSPPGYAFIYSPQQKLSLYVDFASPMRNEPGEYFNIYFPIFSSVHTLTSQWENCTEPTIKKLKKLFLTVHIFIPFLSVSISICLLSHETNKFYAYQFAKYLT